MTSATDNRTTELLPCPFCGGEAAIHQSENGIWHIDTMKCGNGDIAHHAFVLADTEAEAITAWNTRAYEQRIADMKQLVREMHAEILRESTMVDKDGNERVIPWAKATLDNFEVRMNQLGIGDME